MRLRHGQLSISPTDLSYFLSCRHRTALELSVAHGVRERPVWEDPLLEALFALGLAHERQYVEALRAQESSLVDLADLKVPDDAVAETLRAMKSGAAVIVQGALAGGRWYGRPDVLLRTARPSPVLGDWSYIVADTKLARETRGGTILQLGLYSEMLEAAQGLAPEFFQVVTPPEPGPGGQDADAVGAALVVQSYRFAEYAAYLRLLKSRLEDAVAVGHDALAFQYYPEPVDHCEVCPWSPVCRDRRRRDDHLSLVAGLSRLQRRELVPRGVSTVTGVARLGSPIPFRPARGAVETYERVRDQARVQVESRRRGSLVYELIRPPASAPLLDLADARGVEPVGLARLPEPSPGDVFLDLEGDPLAGEAGREYLFGLVTVDAAGTPGYQGTWADDPNAERRAFEAVVDQLMTRWGHDPGMHIYHYAPYEPAALKRLMGRYASREREIDQLLRGRRFVDLYGVVRQGVRAGVERYSLKNLEPLYGFSRVVHLRDANRALRLMEQAFELNRLDLATPEVRQTVEGYNRDDCVSTLRLRDWLEARRAELIAAGALVSRPAHGGGDAPEKLDERANAVAGLRATLLETVSEDPSARTEAGRAAFLLAYLLDWHRREDKAGWWEYFRLSEMPEDDLLDEPGAVAGLTYVAEIAQVKKSAVLRFSYPEQEFGIRVDARLKTQDGQVFGTVDAVDREARTLDIVVGPSRKAVRPSALFAHDHVSSQVIEDALFDLGGEAARAGGVDRMPPSPARALLLRASPALSSPSESAGSTEIFGSSPTETTTDFATRIVTRLDRTALAIQGPPGAGKTYTGAQMICALVAAGRKVGVTATSHKVIGNLLDEVARAAAKAGLTARLGRRGTADAVPAGAGAGDSSEPSGGTVTVFADNAPARHALAEGEIDVMGGTVWLWARPEFVDAVDVLFVDEAGQMSLANALAASRAAQSLVLLGDPQQLEQPTKGSHPDGVGVSALQHVLGDAPTMPDGRGLFLPITWRLPPSICAFTSELFYAGQLTSKAGLHRQTLKGSSRFVGAGLWLVEIDHDGNRQVSDEEAAEVARIVAELLAAGSCWTDQLGVDRQLVAGDIRIVAPFNAHVTRIQEAGRRAVAAGPDPDGQFPPVGTVDRFQGQEAPVVIYSMATSRPEDAPRGMEFLYNLNRLNVATSRAQCAAILVASPRLFEAECATPRQMRLANALCRYRELARVLPA